MKSSKSKTDVSVSYNLLSLEADTPEAQELFSKKGSTAEEKYRILDARDKLIRSRIPKVKVRVELATKLFGTCPDMCPEKERYMRQYQRQLTSFEIQQSAQEITVDPKRAIKAYSRSSADQEEPLPHELRPGPTLELTMNYLLHNIVPLAEQNEDILGDWYNFLWDRTRSIRKDITQQQLTNLQVVSLMEKCARFHIHCSSRLCELDLHSFEPKLNDENLMKCLQSLEHLYDDLRRRNVRCPNEPEFRAYQIMMNLNEGDILWDVQQRPTWVLKSREVQAALKVHHCIFNRNFVSFFRLVKSFPYMFSCILHRYFFQVRCTALRALWKSHAFRRTTIRVQMSLSAVQRMLGYGMARQEFRALCAAHNIFCDEENDHLIIDRKKFMMPDTRMVSREMHLIESKQRKTIAEAINGGPLQPNPLLTHVPHSSFTDEGFLIPGSVVGANVSDAAMNASKQHQENVAKSVMQEAQENNAIDTTDSFASAALQKSSMPGFLQKSSPFQGTFRSNVPASSSLPSISSGGTGGGRLAHRAKTYTHIALVPRDPSPPPGPTPQEIQAKKMQSIDTVCQIASNQFLEMVVRKELQSTATEAMIHANNERQLQAQLRQQELARTQLSQLAMMKLMDRMLPSLVHQIAQEEIQRHHLIQSLCEGYTERFIFGLIRQQVPLIFNSILKQKLQEQDQLEKKLRKIFGRLKIRMILQRWFFFTKEKQRKRKLYEDQLIQDMLDFPASNTYGRSSLEMLQHLRGNAKSPNIVKTTLGTSAWLNKYERINTVRNNYIEKVSEFVEAYQRPKNIVEYPPINHQIENRLAIHGEFYRHCWKRRWSSVEKDKDQDHVRPLRGEKSPRPSLENLNCFSSNSYKSNTTDHSPTNASKSHKKSAEEILLEDIRKFTEETKKEKENFKTMDAVLQKTDFSVQENM